jgi:hypothetical protein
MAAPGGSLLLRAGSATEKEGRAQWVRQGLREKWSKRGRVEREGEKKTKRCRVGTTWATKEKKAWAVVKKKKKN